MSLRNPGRGRAAITPVHKAGPGGEGLLLVLVGGVSRGERSLPSIVVQRRNAASGRNRFDAVAGRAKQGMQRGQRFEPLAKMATAVLPIIPSYDGPTFWRRGLTVRLIASI